MTYEEHRRTLIEYLKAKTELADWHGVSDAANDLRVLEAHPPVLSPADRDRAAFDRIADHMQQSDHEYATSAFTGPRTRPISVNVPPRYQNAPRVSWWGKFIHWLESRRK